MFKKRGQTEVGLGTLLLIIIGVVGLILVGMFVYNSWSKISKTTDLVPEDRTLYAQVCAQSLALGESAYCDDFKVVKIDKKEQYMSCAFLNDKFGLNIEDSAVDCTKDYASSKCDQLRTTLEVKVGVNQSVNGRVCSVEEFKELDLFA